MSVDLNRMEGSGSRTCRVQSNCGDEDGNELNINDDARYSFTGDVSRSFPVHACCSPAGIDRLPTSRLESCTSSTILLTVFRENKLNQQTGCGPLVRFAIRVLLVVFATEGINILRSSQSIMSTLQKKVRAI
jgi:hypothetical protein